MIGHWKVLVAVHIAGDSVASVCIWLLLFCFCFCQNLSAFLFLYFAHKYCNTTQPVFQSLHQCSVVYKYIAISSFFCILKGLLIKVLVISPVYCGFEV